jgi:hypothetical protein
MHRLTRDEVRGLAVHRGPGSVSLFMPTHRGGPEVRQDPIRLRNLLAETEDALRSRDRGRDVIDATLRPVRGLLEDRLFWRNQGDGLAIFATPERYRVFRLPIGVEQLVLVGDRFQLKPLLPMLERAGRFYLLALSRQRVRLFEATRHAMRELDTGDVPSRLGDAVGYDWEQRSLQFYTSVPSATGQRAPEFHGHGAGQDDGDAEVKRFLRLVDDGVRGLVADEKALLVVATVEELFGEYRKLSRHPALADDFVRGNPDAIDEKELLSRGWRVAEARHAEERRRAAEGLGDVLGTERGVQKLEDAVVAAVDGRVETLFLLEKTQRWGVFDPERRTVTVHQSPEAADEDLLNRAAVETLAAHGTVYVVPPHTMPVEASPIAAALRY